MPRHRQITDAAVLAALTNPARTRLLDLLNVHGPMTVSALSTETGLAVGSTSHHLRVLAEAGFVTEEPELGSDRRQRWWKLADSGFAWSTEDFATDPAGASTAAVAEHQALQRQFERARDWLGYSLDQSRPRDREYAESAFATQAWLHCTPAELDELGREINETLRRWKKRRRSRDDDRRPVLVFAHGFPCEP
jgi:DNA-binding transcriptional ArsR family regulator